MLRAVVVGFGNIGHAVLEALQASADFEVAGVVSRSLAVGALGDIPVVRDIDALPKPDVAILCSPSRAVPDLAASLLEKGICTVDSYDIHSSIYEVRQRLDAVAKAHGSAAIMSAGWDPGTDETHVIQVPCVAALKDMGHGVDLVRKGVSGSTHSQRMGFTMEINNPALTGQILVAAARAVKKQAPGCYTMIEIPPIHLLEGSTEELIRRLV